MITRNDTRIEIEKSYKNSYQTTLQKLRNLEKLSLTELKNNIKHFEKILDLEYSYV